ncbi:TonB-dependent siderophore receptor [Caulobacter sp. FWC26]|uniref:TonB-dependent receptor plug domain-containing protein n=1 Tax=Caulobacter sp. FWC26 TaxID=69665 RepID=UPI000C156B7E|nr:TonB-dependent receptor [Caulobacter sp. FWC26]AZS21801.1 TonB-dependent receptor [Caulobacter sp. FWC26]
MASNGGKRRAWLLAGVGVSILSAAASDAMAQATAADTQVEEVVVTGSRFGGRTAINSATPIDAITNDELTRGAAPNLQDMLKVAVPSFSTPRPVAAGALDFITPPTMRGLSTGQILVLVNGKRRHTSADLNNGNQIGRGDVAYDFNSIPAAAISRIEVLRDGAAAQYGSDAIAGVMNLQLDKSIGVTANGQAGVTSQGDGRDLQGSIGAGFAVGDGGAIRMTVQYQDHEHSDRAAPDTRQQYFGRNAAGGAVAPSANFGSGTGLTPSSGTLDPREATVDRNIWVFGDPEYTNTSVFLNGELPINDQVTAYGFGGFNRLKGTSFNFFRRAGQDETIRSLYPDGFVPLQDIKLQNNSVNLGLRGDDVLGFKWDLSTGLGTSINDIGYSNSNNVSMGLTTPTTFYRGGSRFRQWTTNLDLTRQLDLGLGSPLKLALGAEYRKDYYDLVAGELASYANGGGLILDGPNAGKPAPVGAQPGGGITPADAAAANRTAKALYAEIEKDFGDRFMIDAAIRYEDYSDFGSTTNYKVAGRFELFEGLAVRASAGSGFRAPALAQSYFGNTNISFVNGQPLKILTVPVNTAIGALVGTKPLTPEKSDNISVGAVFQGFGLSGSVDWYRIAIDDRIVMSSNFQSTALTTLLASKGYSGISAVAFESNAVDTTTTGVDVTVRHKAGLGDFGELTTTLAANFNKTRLDRVAGTPAPLAALGIATPLFDLTQQVRTTDSTPKDKITLNFNWEKGPWSVNLTGTRYGQVSQVGLTGKTQAQVAALIPGYNVTVVPSAPGSANSDIIQRFRADIVADLDVAWRVNDKLRLSAGVNNVFDKYPEKQIASTAASVAAGTNGSDNNGIFPYAYVAPYGVNGRTYYIKTSYRF